LHKKKYKTGVTDLSGPLDSALIIFLARFQNNCVLNLNGERDVLLDQTDKCNCVAYVANRVKGHSDNTLHILAEPQKLHCKLADTIFNYA
jgi:hypothetical protein